MRKNSARKWLHATLDLLPVVIIPIFALYSTNKNATFNQEIIVSENKIVDFNQIRPNFISYTTNISGVDVKSSSTGIVYLSGSALSTGGRNGYRVFFENTGVTSLLESHKYYLKFNLSDLTQYYLSFHICNLTDSTSLYSFTESSILNSIDNNSIYFGLNFTSTTYIYDDLYFTFDLFDLTQMFGSGFEPTIQQFNQWYPNDYYDYTLSEKQLVKDYSQVTYNDTDIGSQFIYGLYNSVDKYFNIGNVFNLGSIYDWLNFNIFNGNAPIAIYIVWNIVAYEFLMDLLFLLYGLFMFFIDTCTNLMDRFYSTLSGRR